MKTEDLKTFEQVTCEQYVEIVTGERDRLRLEHVARPAVLIQDLPQRRDAKTDPPKDDAPVVMYFRNGLREIGIFNHGAWRYFDRDEGLAVPQEPWEVVEKWSEILHW